MQQDQHRKPEEVEQYNEQVWDLVLNLAHPGFLYVVFQVVIVSHLGAHPLFRQYDWSIYIAQFLGAWALFYSTMLRDMGYRSLAAPALALLGLVGAVAQFFVFPDPAEASRGALTGFLAVQLVPAVLLWGVTMRRWLVLKREHVARAEAEAEAESEAGGAA